MRHIYITVTEDLRKLIEQLNEIFHRYDKEGEMTKVESLRGLISDLELATKGLRDLLRQLEAEEPQLAAEEANDKEIIRAAESTPDPEPVVQAETDSIDVPQGGDQPPPVAEAVDNRPTAD